MRFSIWKAAVWTAAVVTSSTAFAGASEPTGNRFTLVNDGDSPITFVAFTPTGVDRWFSVEGGPIGTGAAGHATVFLPGSACVFDFRIRYGQRAPLTIKAWNACHDPILHVGHR
jgi:hypothetical protein